MRRMYFTWIELEIRQGNHISYIPKPLALHKYTKFEKTHFNKSFFTYSLLKWGSSEEDIVESASHTCTSYRNCHIMFV